MINNVWDKKKSLGYIKIGSFFLIAFVLFFATLMSMKEFSFNVFKGSYNLIVKFDFVEGLHSASPVRFCGVNIGEVKKVIIKEEFSQPKVYVYAAVQKGIKIPVGAYFFVNSLSLFGEKYLEISPPAVVSSYITPNETIEGVSPVPLFKVVASFNRTMNELNEFVKEGSVKTALENTISNIEVITLDLKGIVGDMRDKRGTVGRLLYDDTLYITAEEFIKDIKAHPWKLLHRPRGE